jgi:hypothetical protein
MKSARMLTAMAIIALAAMISGCMQPSWGISPPAGWSPLSRAEQSPGAQAPVAQAPAQQAAPAAKPDEDARPDATHPPADVDPSVAELIRKIEALASREPVRERAVEPTTQPATVAPAAPASPSVAVAPAPAPTGPATAPAPALVQVAPTAPVAAVPPDQPPRSTPVASIATQPAPADPLVANVPIAVAGANQKFATEVVASPAPRAVPVIQPSAITPPEPSVSPVVTVEITGVRPVISTVAVEPNAALATANQPAAEAEQPAATGNLESFITRLEKELQQRPPHPQDELRLRLLYLAAGMDAKLAEPVKGMDPIQSELLDVIVKAVATSQKAMLEPMNASSSALAATEELRRLLGQQSGVSIPRIVLVTKVASYGDYEEISPLRFAAGSDIHAYVYTEVANFRSEPIEGDRLRTLLSERVQVFDSSGKVMWEHQESNIEDRVRTPRRDFFIPFPMKLPATLAPGEYVLKVTIEDRIGGTTDQQRLSFSIQ